MLCLSRLRSYLIQGPSVGSKSFSCHKFDRVFKKLRV